MYLRAFEPEDYLLLHKWRNDDDIAHYFSRTMRYTSTLNEKNGWKKDFDKNNVNYAICIKETNEFIGCIFLIILIINESAHCQPLSELKNIGTKVMLQRQEY